MITDPAALFALALCVGILGLLVLILPLMILFWSQMEPQLVGLVSGGGAKQGDDEYPSQAVLPKLMKSFGNLADQQPSNKGGAKAKPKARKPVSTSRSKARTTSKTVKTAPTKKSTSKKAASKKAKPPKAKAAKAKPKPKSTAGAAAKSKPAARTAVKKAKPAARRTPAGAKRDPILGVVYSKKPKEIDDLKEIKGVAKVIEAKLHKAGIYTYRQIVEWDAAAIDAFSEKLSFKGRIRNEGWQKQCAKFHKDKYGKKIG